MSESNNLHNTSDPWEPVSGSAWGTAFRKSRAVVLTCTIITAVSCSTGPKEADYFRILQTPGSNQPATKFDELRLADRHVVAEWVFSKEGTHEQWAFESGGPRKEQAGKQHQTPPSATPVRLLASVGLESTKVDHIRIVINGPLKEKPDLSWASRSQRIIDERGVTGEPEDPTNRFSREFLFRVGGNDRWIGTIDALRLILSPQDPSTFHIVKVEALSHKFSVTTLENLADRAWKISRQGVQRIGFLGIPGQPVPIDIEAHTGEKQLRFRLTLGEHSETPAIFRVVDPSRNETLFEHQLDPSQPAWSDEFQINLPPTTQHFELTTSLSGIPDPLIGLPAWGTIRVVSPINGQTPVNVVLICLDTLRADHLSLYGYDRKTSPNIDDWAAERGVVFENAFASAPWTLPSHISFLTGVDALHNGANYDKPAPRPLTYLAEYLQQQGYATTAITGGVYLDPNFGLDQGFDVFSSWKGNPKDELENHGPLAIKQLATNDLEPFFLFFHTYEIHDPFREREPFFSEITGHAPRASRPEIVGARSLPNNQKSGFMERHGLFWKHEGPSPWKPLGDDRLQEAIDRYDAGIAAADATVGSILNGIYRSALGTRTLVILTSDHGEALGERGLAGHSYLDDFNLHVPLIMATPRRIAPPSIVSRQVRLVDLVPTVLDVVGIDQEKGLDGVSLLSMMRGRKAEGEPVHPLDVWSYAASTNRGIGLREAETGYRYELNNTAWEGAFQHDRFEQVSQSGNPIRPEPLATEEKARKRLRLKVIQKAAEAIPGLWIRVENQSNEPIEVSLISWNIVDTHRLKCLKGPRGLKWSGRGTVSFVAEKNDVFLLQAEIVKLEPFRIQVSGGAGPDLEQDIDLATLNKPQISILGETGWESGSTEGKANVNQASIKIWRTLSPSGIELPTTLDQGLIDQLKALGYVNN